MQSPAFDEAFEEVSKLAATFKANEARYLSLNYQETEVRNDFIDKFFIALGWDVNHDDQKNPFEQEVKVERGVTAAASNAAPTTPFTSRPTSATCDSSSKPRNPLATSPRRTITFRSSATAGTARRPWPCSPILSNSRSWTAATSPTLTPRSSATSQIPFQRLHRTKKSSPKSSASSPAKPSPPARSKNSPKRSPKNAARPCNAACSRAATEH